MQAQGQGLLAVLQGPNLVVERAIVGSAGSHVFDVATRAEGLADSSEDDDANVRIRLQHEQDLAQRGRDDIAQRIAALGAIERHGGNVVRHSAKELLCSGIDRAGHQAASAALNAGRASRRSA